MTLAQVLSTYATLNISLALAFVTLKTTSFLAEKWSGEQSAEAELRTHYLILTAVIVIAAVHPFIPKTSIFEPAAKVWSAPSMKSFPDQFTVSEHGGYLALPFGGGHSTFNADQISLSLLAVAMILLTAGTARIFRDINRLRLIRRTSFLLRRIGRVSIFANDNIAVPFSYWIPGHHDVVIPSSLTSNPLDYRIAVTHELQHHRQNDTRWIYVLWFLKLICIPNPFIHMWNRWLSEIQEFACDETLVGRNKVKSLQYARCLVQVAETALSQKYAPVCATGLTFLVEQNLLKRRIEKMISTPTRIKNSKNWFLVGGLVTVMTATAFASQGMIQDRRVSLEDAKQMASHLEGDSEFPVVVNDLVLTQLNRYIGTPEGREFMRSSLKRMEDYRPVIERKLAKYEVPSELMALPIIESGYQNLAANNSTGIGAGIWMFISSTARNYGLRVDRQVDERLNPTLLTDAAMRYLKGNNLQFNDWLLAALAYNAGEKSVREAILATGSRDAWVLVRRGYENDKDYLAKLTAAILIMRNPESLD